MYNIYIFVNTEIRTEKEKPDMSPLIDFVEYLFFAAVAVIKQTKTSRLCQFYNEVTSW